MLIGPMLSGDNDRGRIGGAAGNRTRVQSAYFVRVYLHSRSKPRHVQYRGGRTDFEVSTRPPGAYRTTSTGTGACETTSEVWLPSSSRPMPRRPCEAMAITSQPRDLAVSTMASAGEALAT